MSQQNKFAETAFWDKVAKQRVYAAFDNEEYEALIDEVWGSDMSGLTSLILEVLQVYLLLYLLHVVQVF